MSERKKEQTRARVRRWRQVQREIQYELQRYAQENTPTPGISVIGSKSLYGAVASFILLFKNNTF